MMPRPMTGERYDVIWEAREPGTWLLRSHIGHHIGHHIGNDGAEVEVVGGLAMVIAVSPAGA